MARKYVRGYTIDDIKVGMKIKEKGDKEVYGIIVNMEDVHNVEVDLYNLKNKKVGFAMYCFDKKCQFEYNGGIIEILESI